MTTSRQLLLTAIISLVASVPVLNQDSGKITGTNWRQHPKIKAVRDIVAAVDAGMKRGVLKTSTRTFEYCEPYEDTVRRSTVDSGKSVRRYDREGGSEDSSLTLRHYYDPQGRLRFVFITGGAVNGAQLEQRIYFDENGERIWEEHKYTKGPEYTFPEVWPDEQLQKSDPAKAFAAVSPCKEVKTGSRRRG
ncbi:MAG TPA: hypothetical protein VJT71_07375 [Pyrinomonadaceae bacterium]|nr:hypothetical protein [Pyrinomonadaceae bacterium]